MCDSTNATARSAACLNSQLSFYEYPPHKPFTNSIYQPLRPSHNLSRTVTLPESHRDSLLNSFETLSLKIKTLENQREQAELSLHELTNGLTRSPSAHQNAQPTIDEQLEAAEENFRRLQDQHRRVLQVLNPPAPSKPRAKRKKKRPFHKSHTIDSTQPMTSAEGRHYHLDIHEVPFILGQSTAPSHNVKSNVQNVIALLKNHNHQLCLSSKQYNNLLHPRQKTELSPHSLLYLDHYTKQPSRPLSASPTRSNRRVTGAQSVRRPQTASSTDTHCYSRIKCLRREYVILSREHARLHSSQSNAEELEMINRRMQAILEELDQLERQYMTLSESYIQDDLNETPIETLRRTRLLQLILKDPATKAQRHYD